MDRVCVLLESTGKLLLESEMPGLKYEAKYTASGTKQHYSLAVLKKNGCFSIALVKLLSALSTQNDMRHLRDNFTTAAFTIAKCSSHTKHNSH